MPSLVKTLRWWGLGGTRAEEQPGADFRVRSPIRASRAIRDRDSRAAGGIRRRNRPLAAGAAGWRATTPQTTAWPPRWFSSAARAHAVVVSALTPAEVLNSRQSTKRPQRLVGVSLADTQAGALPPGLIKASAGIASFYAKSRKDCQSWLHH